MKILEIDFEYFYYPEGVSDIAEFIEYVNANFNTFISLVQFNTEECVFPYLIKEETKQVFVNVSNIDKIKEVDATILCRVDYDNQLERVVKTKCINCVNYLEDSDGDKMKGHREKLSLDGECWAYEEKDKDI